MCKRRLDRKIFAYSTVFVVAVLCHAQGPPTYYIQTVVGTGGSAGFAGDGGPATSAQLNNPTGVAVDGAGTIYIADQVNHRIREVAKSNGLISTQAGNGTAGYAGDGSLGINAELNSPLGVVVDASGNFYIADTLNNVIRKVTPTDTISTFAGNNSLPPSFSGDGGPATSADFDIPGAVALDSAGNLYIVDTENNRVRKVTASSNIITTIAGNGQLGYSGDGGLATIARLFHPLGVAVDSHGTVYIADSGNHVIRKITGNIITTVAGTAVTPGFFGDGGPAVNALLNHPSGVAVDAAGNLYIADTTNGRIRVVINGTIYTIAGNGRLNIFAGDGGLATNASLSFPYSVTVDSQGNVFVADTQNHVIRELSISTFFTGEISLGSGVYYLTFPNGNLFGYYTYLPGSFMYHYDMGFEYVFPANDAFGDVYFYDFQSGHWWYTGPSLFPNLYDFTLGAWIFYFSDPSNPGHYTANPRKFAYDATHVIFTM